MSCPQFAFAAAERRLAYKDSEWDLNLEMYEKPYESSDGNLPLERIEEGAGDTRSKLNEMLKSGAKTFKKGDIVHLRLKGDKENRATYEGPDPREADVHIFILESGKKVRLKESTPEHVQLPAPTEDELKLLLKKDELVSVANQDDEEQYGGFVKYQRYVPGQGLEFHSQKAGTVLLKPIQISLWASTRERRYVISRLKEGAKMKVRDAKLRAEYGDVILTC